MRRTFALLLALAASTGVACSASPDEEEDVEGAGAAVTQDLRPELAQVNDVSILFPLAKSQAAFERGYLTPASPGLGGALLPKAVYEKAFGPPGTLQIGGTPAAPLLSGLRLVAVRFDPCFAQRGEITNDAACKNQVRLVFQTLTFENGRVTAADDAVHAFYAISRAELTRAVRATIALRMRRAGERRLGPLAPHPLLRATNGDLELTVAKELNDLVRSLAGAQNLVQFTQFAPSGLDTTWNFSGFDAAKSETLKIPTLPASDHKHVAFFAGFTPGQLEGDPAFVPASKAPAQDNVQLLGNRLTAAAASASDRKRAFEALLRLEHPDVHTPDTIDCASCHAVAPVRALVGKKHFASELAATRGAFVADSKYVPLGDLVATESTAADINVHMFSYKGQAPSVHPRTVNESAAIVALLNKRILER